MPPRLLASELATPALAARGLAPVSRLGLEALAARAIFEARSEEGLRYFGEISHTPGFTRAFASTLEELRLDAASPGALRAAGPAGADLALLADLFEQQLQGNRLVDLPALLQLATEAANANAKHPHRLLGLPLLLFDLDPQSALHLELLQAVARRAPDVLVLSRTRDERALRGFSEALAAVAEPIEATPPASALDRIRTDLFIPELPVSPRDPWDASFEMFSAPGEGLECVEIARRVRRLAATGVPFDRLAVLLRSPERYQPLLEEAFRRAAIPGWFRRGSARPDPAGRAFLALLACAADRLSASRFAEYLSLAQVPPVDAAGAPAAVRVASAASGSVDDELARFQLDLFDPPPSDAAESESDPDAAVSNGTLRAPSGWEKLLVDAAVINGKDRWQRRLDGLAEEFRIQRRAADSTAARQAIDRHIAQLEHLRNFALPLIGMLAELPSLATWGEWLQALERLARHSLRQPETVLGMLAELQPMAEVGPVGFEEVTGVLEDRLRFLRVEPLKSRYGAVFVGSLEEARGWSFDVVFLPGLAEGQFPRRVFEDPLLLDDLRERVSPRLKLRDDRVASERQLLSSAAAAAERQLVASFPRMEVGQNRPRVPSFYALELPRAANGALPPLRAFERQARDAAPARLHWPAPRDFADAVDDVEYDLAVLGPLLAENREAAVPRGAGRYLMQASAPLARSLRARYSRWDSTEWHAADGLLKLDAAAQSALDEHRLSKRVYSPSTLQLFASCPYRFALQGIHRLRPREQGVPLERMDPLTRGALYHAVQFRLFRDLEQRNLLPVQASRLSWILQRCDETLDTVEREFADKLAPAIPNVWRSEIEDLRTDLRGSIHLALEDPGWLPIHFEFGFGVEGGDGRDEASVDREATVLDAAHVRGSVDRIERHVERGTLRVIDFKTGKPPGRAPMYTGGGAVLQPLLYSLAIQQILETPVECGTLLFATQRGGYKSFECKNDERGGRELQLVLVTIDRMIENGFVPAAPQAKACDYCDYQAVCGPREPLRVARKHREELDPLNEIRSRL